MSGVSDINLIGMVVGALQSNESWCGETHIQKSAYVAKVTQYVPFGSHFILYKHGPFSFDLNNLLTQMRAQQIITVTPQGNYGSTYRLNDGMWKAVSRAASARYSSFEGSIRFVCGLLAKKKVADLERVATAVYVRVNFGQLNESEQHRKLTELKPHIPLPEARAAFDEAKVFFSKPEGALLLGSKSG